MLTLLKGSTVAAGWLAATVTGIVFAQAGGSGLGASGSGGPAPGERPQAAAGHAQAGNRVALLSLWISDWTPPSQQPRQDCSGGACTTTEGGWDGPDIQINGDHFNYGPVVVEVRSNDGTVLWCGVADTGPGTGFPGGAFAVQAGLGNCSQVPNTAGNDYAIAYDTVSGRWSNRVPVDSSCASC